jgi:predicted DNA-binding ribbon-helix-helix protein
MNLHERPKSLIQKRSVVLRGHKTSVSLESAFWTELKKIARKQGTTISSLLTTIDEVRSHGNLSSAIRLFILRQISGAASQTESH